MASLSGSGVLKLSLMEDGCTTVTLHWAFTLPALADITALPAATAVTLPLSTVATAGAELLQVMFGSVAFSGRTVAVSCSLAPTISARVV